MSVLWEAGFFGLAEALDQRRAALPLTPIRPRPDGVREDGAIEMKVGWWRGIAGRLRIEGRRLDATAPPLSVWIPGAYGRKGFQSTAITFPTAGCWQVTGSVGNVSLTFVSLILEPV